MSQYLHEGILNDSVLTTKGKELFRGMGSAFFEDPLSVGADRVFADLEDSAYFLIRTVLSDQLNDLHLSRCEQCQVIPVNRMVKLTRVKAMGNEPIGDSLR